MDFSRVWGSAILAIPFYYLWNYFGPIYFSQLPQVYLNLPFWHCVGLCLLLGIVATIIFPSTLVTKHLKFK